jgi:tRNA(Ile)-lysidine synthase
MGTLSDGVSFETMDVVAALDGFIRRLPLAPGEPLVVVVAFSGGGDSTALLWGLSRLAPGRQVRLVAAHLDHALDGGSAARARRAATLALCLKVPMVAARREIAARRAAGESLEAAARRVRYQFLEEVRHACGTGWIATAHHREDQAETLLLRLRQGSGLRGLQGIRPVTGRVVRPLLDVPRSALRQAVAAAGLAPCEDPGNLDPRQPRALVRRWVLPALARGEAALGEDAEALTNGGALAGREKDCEPGMCSVATATLSADLARLAARAQRAMPALDHRLAAEIGLCGGGAASAGAAAIADRRRLRDLPPPLLPHALALLHRRAGAALPPSRGAAGELRRQLLEEVRPSLRPRQSRRQPGCDCGAGWRWQARGEELWLCRAELRGTPAQEAAWPPDAEPIPRFTYTVEVPGEIAIPEIAAVLRVRRQPFADWMLRGAPLRAALALPEEVAGRLTVRNRRPGDRLRPLGAAGSRRLKDVLIDRGIPRHWRDRLPLLCWAGGIAWVPGVTIEHRFRLAGQPCVCVAEVLGGPWSSFERVAHRLGGRKSPAGNPVREPAVSQVEGIPAPRG